MQFQSADIVAVQNKVVLRVHGWEPVPGRVDIVKKVTTEIVIRPETARELARNVMVRNPAGRVWVWENSKCGYVCYEVTND